MNELQELEQLMRRFDGFKQGLQPSPQALKRAISLLAEPRRSVRWHFAIAPAVALAAFVLFTPASTPSSALAMDIVREEQIVEAALAPAALDTSVVDADASLDELASLL